MPDKPLVKYIGFIIAFLTSLFTIIAPEAWTWFSPDIGWALAGLFGSVGLLQFRTFIGSKQAVVCSFNFAGWCYGNAG